MGKHLRRRVGLGLGILSLILSIAVLNKVSSKAQTDALVVDGGRLRSHLTQIAAERYTNLALARTRAYMAQQLEAYGYTLTYQEFGTGSSAGTNLIAVHPGTRTPDQKILVGAHYDSVLGSPGADDNTSAVAAGLEIARLFAKRTTDKTLEIVFFDQEERQPEGAGLLGSNAYVDNADNLTGLESAVILEMLGYACHEPGCQTYPPGLEDQNLPVTGDFISVIGDTDHPELLNTFITNNEAGTAEQLRAVTLPVPIGSLPFMPDLFRSDHAPFWLKGIGAVMVSDTANFRTPHYHQPSDTVANLDLAFLEQTANYVVERIATLLQSS